MDSSDDTTTARRDRAQEEPGEFQPLREAATVLRGLLDVLFPNPESLDIITVDDIVRRYPLTGLGAPALSAIDQTQRIIRARGDYGLAGQSEFHVGLIYLYFGDRRAAAAQFAAARQPWTLNNDTPAIALAHYAQGVALYHAFHNEAAMMQYSRAERHLNRAQAAVHNERVALLSAEMRPLLAVAQEALRQTMWPDEVPQQVLAAERYLSLSLDPAGIVPAVAEANGEPESLPPAFEREPAPAARAAVARPISNLPEQISGIAPGPVPGHLTTGQSLAWFLVTGKQSEFLPQVRVGAWVLVNTSAAGRGQDGPDYVLVESHPGGDSSIQLRSLADPDTVSYCHLAFRPAAAEALPEAPSQLLLDSLEQPADVEDEAILGIIEGFWLGIDAQGARNVPRQQE